MRGFQSFKAQAGASIAPAAIKSIVTAGIETARQVESRVVLSPGDLVVLYSDGITEAADAKDEEFGMERLTELLRTGRALPPNVLKDRIFAAVETFTRGVAQYDDQTVLVARPT